MKSDIAIRNEIIEYTQAIENHKALVAILKFIKLMYKKQHIKCKGEYKQWKQWQKWTCLLSRSLKSAEFRQMTLTEQ